jgi:(1->4)-alpha-D-glucan 1-alpha-D-glucosylmutase
MPAAWRLGLARWRRLAQGYKTEANGAPSPSAADEYLLYQTLLGTLPAQGLDEASLPDYRQRIEQYMLKAAREAKRHTSWTCPDEAYEAALGNFLRSVLARVQPNPLLSDLQTNAAALAWFGALNTLSMVLMKFTSPGVPDLYQGNELMDLSLVDPDNRREIDFALRENALSAMEALQMSPEIAPQLQALVSAPNDGQAKLWLTWRLLQLRAEHTELFREGRYLPLTVTGERSDHLVAYAREHGNEVLVVLAPRLYSKLQPEVGRLPLGAEAWGDTVVELSPLSAALGARWSDALTGRPVPTQGGSLRLAEVLGHLPFSALLLTR